MAHSIHYIPPTGPRPALAYEELRDVIELALWAGQLLLQYGAESDRVEETVHRLGTALGCDWMDVLVSPNGLVVTTISGGDFRTRIRRVTNLGVNLAVVSAISDLSRQAVAGRIDRHEVREQLEQIGKAKLLYPNRVRVAAVGLACAALSQLLGGDWSAFLATFIAATFAMSVRIFLHHRYVNQQIITVLTACAAGIIASFASFVLSPEAGRATFVASAILLVPGVHLINSVEDLIKAHFVTGAVRGLLAMLVLLGIALGLLLASAITGRAFV